MTTMRLRDRPATAAASPRGPTSASPPIRRPGRAKKRDGQRHLPAEMSMTPRGERDPFAEIGDIGSTKEKTLPVAPQAKPRSSSPWKAASNASKPSS